MLLLYGDAHFLSHFLRMIRALEFCQSLSVIAFIDFNCWVEYVICLISLLLYEQGLKINVELSKGEIKYY